ncbi:hypothetical protein CAEBREN_31286 [Caenorhabditis brenneri]|uniref:Uncharacterized protein n=1 Tax=Caenorhabditis brenneri TaxID=135651 RepID=G0NAB3_CAEBE|nr:hypothetical protein CAEBREN_31286 [Caenorhabditis brenneri]
MPQTGFVSLTISREDLKVRDRERERISWKQYVSKMDRDKKND